MLTYTAMYKEFDGGVHAEVLDFPGVITCGREMSEARRLLSDALKTVAESILQAGGALPKPDPRITDPDADLVEPIRLILTAAHRVPYITRHLRNEPDFS
jgi:predicted RNase H-like HicB family nuclease